ncbi:hypothetical protein L915_03846 [Phytophthora nicotianae]|uniref:Uncharacterized protein n=4 Tax=Phytophthora nicotianae TaxID=4792 RepID=W2HCL4_PHYNI|nr:hypothetical protein L915_03846 [Phytophthora nicotianae]ETO81740.1 hypothetical protein F444_04012 [Phytophthora nicotianae P1976]
MKRPGEVVPSDYGVRQRKRLKEAKFPHAIRALPHAVEHIDMLSMSVEDAAVEAAATNQLTWLQILLPLVSDKVKDQAGCDTTDIAAAHGHCEAIKLIYRWWVQPARYSKPTQLCTRALANAVSGGHLQTVETLLGQWGDFFDGERSTFENAFTIPRPCHDFDILEALELAVKNKNDKIIRVICEKSGLPGEILRWAAKNNNLDVLRIMDPIEVDYREDLYRAMLIAVERGFLKIVKFLTAQCGEDKLENVTGEYGFFCPLVTAIEHGRREIIEFLDAWNMHLGESLVPVFCAAAAFGPLDLVQMFYDREKFDSPALNRAFASAAGKNQLEIMAYLQTKQKFGRAAIDKALNSAARGGHLDAVRRLCDIEDYEISDAALNEAFENAAESWHLDMVKFLDTKGTISRASINTAFMDAMDEPGLLMEKPDNQLETLKLLHNKGCIYPEAIPENFANVARNCHVDIVEFLYSKSSMLLSSSIMDKAFKKATRENSIEVVEFLYKTGAVSIKSIEDTFFKAASRGDLYMMECLVNCGCQPRSLLEKALCKHASLPHRVLLFLKQKREITV